MCITPQLKVVPNKCANALHKIMILNQLFFKITHCSSADLMGPVLDSLFLLGFVFDIGWKCFLSSLTDYSIGFLQDLFSLLCAL